MTERVLPSEGFDFWRLCPWGHLVRSFRLALRIRQMLLGALGILLATGGMRLIDSTFAEPVAGVELSELHPWPWEVDLGYAAAGESWIGLPGLGSKTGGGWTSYPSLTAFSLPGEGAGLDAVSALSTGLAEPRSFLETVFSNWQVVLLPVRSVLKPVQVLFHPDSTGGELGVAFLQVAWWLLVWSLMGGAISRSAAVEFARDQSTHLPGAVRFAATRYLSYLAGPLLPVAGILLFWGLCALGGLTGRISGAGPLLLGLMWGLILVFGVVLAIIIMGLATGWPLMFATISVEGTDGFDGMSRAYNYVYERPLHYLGYIILTLVYGSFAVFCVLFMAQFALRLSIWGVAWGGGNAVVRELSAGAPSLLAFPASYLPQESAADAEPAPQAAADAAAAEPADATTDEPVDEAPGGGKPAGENPAAANPAGGPPVNAPVREPTVSTSQPSLGGLLSRFWMNALATLVVGFVYSFFWSSVTVMYFLLRRSVDGNEFDEVFLGTSPEPDDLLPLVGAAAMGIDLSTVGSAPPSTALAPDNPPYPKPT